MVVNCTDDDLVDDKWAIYTLQYFAERIANKAVRHLRICT